MTPSLTYIIASRNDEFCGDSMARLLKTVNRIHGVGGVHPTAEIIIVDWGSKLPIKSCTLSPFENYIYVPPKITERYQTPFNEVLALNIGIRRATTPWIARLDQDILVGERFVEWFEDNGMDQEGLSYAYFSERRDMLHFEIPEERPPRWSDWKANYPYFYRAAVGILLAPRTAWHQLRGYNEKLILRNHMEHDLCARFKKTCGLVNLGPLVDYDFYHQWHERIANRGENIILSEQELDLVSLDVNNENWGMGDVEL